MEPKFTVQDAGIRGEGLFASVAFTSGDEVYRYESRIVHQNDLGGLTEDERTHLDIVSPGVYALIPEPLCFVNHSCNPNIAEKNYVGYAVRDIALGEELTIDYEIDSFFDKPMQCLCGSVKCRGTIGDGKI